MPIESDSSQKAPPLVEVRNLHKSFEEKPVLTGLDVAFQEKKTTVVLGPSGCGKSVLLKHLIGLLRPREGDILYSGESFVSASSQRRDEMRRGWGISYQTGGLFSAMTLGENVAIPLQQYSDYTPGQVDDVVELVDALLDAVHQPAEGVWERRQRRHRRRGLLLGSVITAAEGVRERGQPDAEQ